MKYKVSLLSFTLALLLSLSNNKLSAQEDFQSISGLIYEQKFQQLKDLLDKGFDVNTTTDGGSTLLMQACFFNNTLEAINLLIDHGANVNAVDDNGYTALMFASKRSGEYVSTLLNAGARADIKAYDGMTALIQSVFGNLRGKVGTDVCDQLLDQGADINYQFTGSAAKGWTVLMYAAANGKTELAQYLLDRGADRYLQSADGQTAMSLAEKSYNDQLIHLLEK